MATRVKVTGPYPTAEDIARRTRIPKARREELKALQHEYRRKLLSKKMKELAEAKGGQKKSATNMKAAATQRGQKKSAKKM